MISTKTGVVSPLSSVVPDYIGQHYVDTIADLVYVAYGLTNIDWQEIGAGGGGEVHPSPATVLADISDGDTVQMQFGVADTLNSVTIYSTAGAVINFVQSSSNFDDLYTIDIVITPSNFSATAYVDIHYNGTLIAPFGAAPVWNAKQRIIRAQQLPGNVFTAEWIENLA